MSAYLDTSFLVSLFTDDSFSNKADRLLENTLSIVLVSDFAAAEFASAIGRLVRTQEITTADAQEIFSNFDIWSTRATHNVEVESVDIAASTNLLRRLDSPLRAPDALHVMIARRLNATLFTFDVHMASAARKHGIDVVGD